MEVAVVGVVGALAAAWGVVAWSLLVGGDTSDTPEDAISLTDLDWDAPASSDRSGRWAGAILVFVTFVAGFVARFLAVT
jgi:hypothetical protein